MFLNTFTSNEFQLKVVLLKAHIWERQNLETARLKRCGGPQQIKFIEDIGECYLHSD